MSRFTEQTPTLFHAVNPATGAARLLLTMWWADSDPDAQAVRIVEIIPDGAIASNVSEQLRAVAPHPRTSLALPGAAPPRRTPPPSARCVSDLLGVALVVRSWSAAPLFGADIRDALALRRHRDKVRFLVPITLGAHVPVIQESHGTAEDFAQFHDLLPGWECHRTFTPYGTSGETLILLSPLIIAAYPAEAHERGEVIAEGDYAELVGQLIWNIGLQRIKRGSWL